MKRSKRILILITHSLGELDVLFPLITGVKGKYDVDVEMIFAVNKLYKQYLANDFYKYCSDVLGVKITNCQLPNKFDYRDGFYYSKFGSILVRCYFLLLIVIKFPFLFQRLYISDAYMHEHSNQRGSTKLLYLASRCFNKKIFIYNHGHSLNQVNPNTKKISQIDSLIYLSFHIMALASLFYFSKVFWYIVTGRGDKL